MKNDCADILRVNGELLSLLAHELSGDYTNSIMEYKRILSSQMLHFHVFEDRANKSPLLKDLQTKNRG